MKPGEYFDDQFRVQTISDTYYHPDGQILEEERTFTPRVSAAVEDVHRAMAELQKATIEHLFEMEQALTAEQYNLLLKLAGEALSQ